TGRMTWQSRLATPVTKELDCHWRQRNDHDPESHNREVVAHDGHVAERVAGAHTQPNPQHAPDDVVDGEGPISHRSGAGHEGHEGPDDGHEPREHHREPAMTLEERMRVREMLLVEQPLPETASIVRGENPRTRDAAYLVVDGVADNRRGNQR